MKVRDLSPAEFRRALAGPGLRLRTGLFNCRMQSEVAAIAPEMAQLYAHHELLDDSSFIDFHIKISTGKGLRRWLRPQALFSVDEVLPFTPLPQNQALAMIEWGLNWCITAYSHHLLVLHAASLAKGEHALILPAPPGSGKSTLCAALANRGWRLLSDELTLIDLRDGRLHALARPVNLKNNSIDVIRRFAPEAFLSAPVLDTTKGTVALMAPNEASVQAQTQPTWPRWMALPRWQAGAATRLTPMPPGEAFLQLADNAMNYHILGEQGFQALGQLIDRVESFRFEYSDLNEAVALFDQLASSAVNAVSSS